MATAFIGRESYREEFEDKLNTSNGEIIRFSGRPGIGKSTLIREFHKICFQQKRPFIGINLSTADLSTGYNILHELAYKAQNLKSLTEKATEIFQKFKTPLDVTASVAGAIDPTIAVTHTLTKAASGLFQGTNTVPAGSEQALLDELKNKGKKHPICFIDTYEHSFKAGKMLSRIEFSEAIAYEYEQQEYNTSTWLKSLAQFLAQNGWIVVMAGRYFDKHTKKQELPRFTSKEVQTALEADSAFKNYLPDYQTVLLELLNELSFGGNPLWLQVAMNLLETQLEQKGIAVLDKFKKDTGILQNCFEERNEVTELDYEDEHGACKLNMLSLLSKDNEKLDQDAWKIALPRILNNEILVLIFGKEKAGQIHKAYQLAGVFTAVQQQQFQLHEEIRDLLLAYARQNGWLESEEVLELHKQLAEYFMDLLPDKYSRDLELKDNPLYNENISPYQFEAAYHFIMAKPELENHNQISREEFWNYVAGSASLSYGEKLRIAIVPSSTIQIDKLIKLFQEDIENWENLLGKTLAEILHKETRSGKVAGAKDISFWLQRVEEYGQAKDYYFCANIYLTVYREPNEALKYYQALLTHYKNSTLDKDQFYCAKALFDQGTMYGQQDNNEAELESYQQVISHFADSELPEIQEPVARALFNQGIRYGQQGNSEAELESYQQLINRFADSEHPEIQVRVAKVLFYQGVRYGQQDNSEAAIESFQQVISRFADSEYSKIQEQVAKALFNQGIHTDSKAITKPS